MRFASLVCLVVMVASSSAAQIPRDSLALWLRADQGVYSNTFCTEPVTGNSGQVLCWEDLSSADEDVRQAGNGVATFTIPSDTLNGFPAIQFGGPVGLQSEETSAFDFTQATIFIVPASTASSRWFELGRPGRGHGYVIFWDPSRRWGIQHDTASGRWRTLGHNIDFSSEPAIILTGIWGTSPNDLTLLINALESSAALESSGSPSNYPAIPRLAYVGSGFGSTAVGGMIAEVIVYGGVKLDAARRTIVENYLSAKYDIPINPPVDFYAGDTEANGDYDFDVSGIGAEADSSLTEGVSSAGLALAEMNESLDEGEYVLAGHRTMNFDGSFEDVPDGVDARWNREWYVDTNDGSVDVMFTFDFESAGSSDEPEGDYVLLRRDEPFGDFSVISDQFITEGNGVSFEVVDVQDGYYTLGGTNITVAAEEEAQPSSSILSPVFPNPFERQASFALTLEQAQPVSVEVFDVTGKRVAVLHEGPLSAGEHRLTLEAADLPSGTYLIRATGDGFTATQRATLLR